MVSSIAAIPSSAAAAPVDPISAAAGTAASGLEAQAAPGAPAPPVATQTPQAQAVSVATTAAAIRQSSLAPLLADLAQAVSLPGVPTPVQAAISQVLAAQTPLDPPPSAAALQQATAASGLFLEAQLGAMAAPPAGDLKSALLVVQQVLKTWLDSAAPPTEMAVEQPIQTAASPANTSATTTTAPNPPTLVESVQTPAPPAQVTQPAPSPAATLAESPAPSAAAPASSPVSAPDAPAVVTVASASPLAAAVASVPAQTVSEPPASDNPPPTPAQTANAAPAPVQPPLPATAPIAAAQTLAAVAVQQLTSADPDDAPVLQTPTSIELLFGGDAVSSPPATPFATTTAAPPPPPFRDGPTTAQQPVPSSLAAGVEASVAGRRLLTETSGALARQELHQVASLPASQPDQRPADTTNPRWMFELPFSTPQGAAVAQFEISRDGGHAAAADAQPTWRARFSIDLEPMGPVHVQVALTGARAGVSLWAERPATAAQLRAGQAALAEGLEKAEFAPAVSVHVGAPPRSAAPPRAGRFLDQAS
jgi:Flagellar hook-length control protein FliK